MTPQQLKTLKRIAIAEAGKNPFITKHIFDLEDGLVKQIKAVEDKIPDVQAIVDAVKIKQGEKGEDGRDGADGKDGSAGAAGRDGKDGRDGLQGIQGPQGEPGRDGSDGIDGQDGKDGADGFIDVATVAYLEDRIETVEKKIEDAPFKQVGGLGLGAVQRIAADASQNTFEKVSKNLTAYPSVLNYTVDVLSSIVYTTDLGLVTKTLNYTGTTLTSIVLSGALPSSLLTTTKTLSYTGENLTGISYS